MNEIFDKLILRIIFALYLCGILFFYRYAYSFLYPSVRTQMTKRFFPAKNLADTIHLFSRVIGVGILFSQFEFLLDHGFLIALFDFLLFATIGIFLYIVSTYLIESIVLHSFEYQDEVIKNKNVAYSIISFSHAIGVAYLINVVLSVSKQSLTMLIFLWLFAIVLIGITTKAYSYVSKLHFNRLLIQKNIGLSLSYSGFFLGLSIIISGALQHELIEIKWYAIHVILKTILALIIIPIFLKGLELIFHIQHDFNPQDQVSDSDVRDERVIGYGLYEGAIFFTSCFLTKVITEQVLFGTFYPVL